MEHEVRKSQIYKRNDRIEETSKAIWEYMKSVVDENVVREVFNECERETKYGGEYHVLDTRIYDILTECGVMYQFTPRTKNNNHHISQFIKYMEVKNNERV